MLRTPLHALSVFGGCLAIASVATAQPALPEPETFPELPHGLTEPPQQPPPQPPPTPQLRPPMPPPWVPWPAVPTVEVDLTSSTPDVGFQVYLEKAKPGRDAPIAVCPGNCRVFLVPGTYRFVVTETKDTLSGSRMIDVTGPMAIDFDPDTTAQRTTGLVMGIAGPIAMLAGLGLVVGDALDEEYDERDDDETGRSVGGLLLIGGLAATPIGWVMFGKSFKPEYEITKPSWSVGAGATGSGLGLVSVGRF